MQLKDLAAARRSRREGHDRGAALVEFALVVPVLFLLIFGIIDFAWTFGQFLDVRHGAREAARLAAVNYEAPAGSSGATQSLGIVTETCTRLSNEDAATITITLDSTSGLTEAQRRAVGRPVSVSVTQQVDSLTGFLDPFLPSSLTSSADSRLEQVATFNDSTGTYTSGCP